MTFKAFYSMFPKFFFFFLCFPNSFCLISYHFPDLFHHLLQTICWSTVYLASSSPWFPLPKIYFFPALPNKFYDKGSEIWTRMEFPCGWWLCLAHGKLSIIHRLLYQCYYWINEMSPLLWRLLELSARFFFFKRSYLEHLDGSVG